MSRASFRIALLISGIALAGSAQAQTMSDASAPQKADRADPNRPGEDGARVDDIIVTAQKRSERLQDVPITINAVSGDMLDKAGVETLGGVAQLVPAFRMDNSGVYAQPSIRGVGSSVAGNATGSAVGIYVDGFYVPSPLTTDFDLLTVTGIQVLKGPQGTLFGRNTTAGAILVTTADPSTTTSLAGKLSYARYNALNAQIYGTTAISNHIAADLSAQYRRGDGFIRNIDTDARAGKYENYAIRAGLKIDLDDSGANSILFRYEHNKSDDPTFVAQTVYNNLSIGALIPGTPVATRRGEVSGTGNYFNARVDAGYLTGRADLSFADLVSYTMYRSEQAGSGVDFDGTRLPIFFINYKTFDRTFTQEVDLNSKPGGALKWVVGGYFFRDHSGWYDVNTSFFGSPLTPLWTTSNKVTSSAVFADATYAIANRLYLTAGLRYSHEHNDAYYDLAQPDAATGQPIGFYPAQHSWNSLTPRAVARYEFNSSSSVYLSFSKGFKSGFLNTNGLTKTPVKPEKISAYEAGYKYSSGRTHFQISAFKYDYSNLQVATYNGQLALVTNAASSKLYGGEFDLSTTIGDNLDLSLAGAYTHSKYTSYPGAPLQVQVLDPANPAFGTFQTVSTDATGNMLQRAPKFSGSASITYKIPLATGSLDLNANASYQSKVYFDPANQFAQRGYALINLQVEWKDSSGRFGLAVFAKNLTDKSYKRTVFPAPFSILAVYGEPISYGTSLSFAF